jgi:predicted deacylase
MSKQDFYINGRQILPGMRMTIDLPVPKLYTHTDTTMPVHVVRGRKDGPHLFVCAAIHGDEINGIEIIRRLLKYGGLKRLAGTLVAVPIVNVYGVIHHSRYLPDRRDLNRSFPGSETGSLAARLAHLFMQQIVSQCTHGIDLHTGAVHRANLPQIRANLDDPATERLARAFGVPVLLNSSMRDGSLRQSADEAGIPMLLYEAGEALRFDELYIRAGFEGIKNVMRALDMLPLSKRGQKKITEPFVAHSSAWARAPESGMLRTLMALGAHVQKNDLLGMISDPFGETEFEVRAHINGVVIGRTNLPLVNEGDALFHIARFGKQGKFVAKHVEDFNLEHQIEAESAHEPPII